MYGMQKTQTLVHIKSLQLLRSNIGTFVLTRGFLRKLSHVKIEAHGMVMVSEIEALPPIEAPLQ